MSAVDVASARRSDQIKMLNRSVSNLDKQVTQGRFAEAGSYLRKHSVWAAEQIETINAEISRLSNLSDDELVAEFAPEVAQAKAIAKDLEDNGPVEFDPMGRGAMMPKQVVVQRTPRPVRREGGEPSPVAPGQVPSR
jgi:hypothetical protein